MPDFEAPPEDALEQEQAAVDAEAAVAGPDDTAVGVETPGPDAQEQRRPVRSDEQPHRTGVPLEADEADAADQAREVGLDEDDYR